MRRLNPGFRVLAIAAVSLAFAPLCSKIAPLYGQTVETGPETGQWVPAFSATDQNGRTLEPPIDHGSEGGHAGLIPFGGLVTVLQNPAHGAATESGRDSNARTWGGGDQLRLDRQC